MFPKKRSFIKKKFNCCEYFSRCFSEVAIPNMTDNFVRLKANEDVWVYGYPDKCRKHVYYNCNKYLPNSKGVISNLCECIFHLQQEIEKQKQSLNSIGEHPVFLECTECWGLRDAYNFPYE